ncbi:unnamed protein product [Caenorhabditis brenneri]
MQFNVNHQTTFDDCGEGYVRNDNGCKRLKHRSTEETPAPIVIPSEHPIFSGKAGEYTIGDVKIHICPGMGSSGFGRKFMEDSFSTTSEFDPTSLTSEV